MDYITELAAIASEHGGIIEAKIAAQRGISKTMLYKLCKEDKIHRILKGQYILPDDMQDELLSISKRSDKGNLEKSAHPSFLTILCIFLTRLLKKRAQNVLFYPYSGANPPKIWKYSLKWA